MLVGCVLDIFFIILVFTVPFKRVLYTTVSISIWNYGGTGYILARSAQIDTNTGPLCADETDTAHRLSRR